MKTAFTYTIFNVLCGFLQVGRKTYKGGKILLEDIINQNQIEKELSIGKLPSGFYLSIFRNEKEVIGIQKIIKL